MFQSKLVCPCGETASMQTRNLDSVVSSGPEFLNQSETMPVDAHVVRFVDGDSISPASIVQDKSPRVSHERAGFYLFRQGKSGVSVAIAINKMAAKAAKIQRGTNDSEAMVAHPKGRFHRRKATISGRFVGHDPRSGKRTTPSKSTIKRETANFAVSLGAPLYFCGSNFTL